jgi:hypothetical protein
VAEYHEASLRELVAHVGVAIDRFRGGELDPFEVDHAVFQYSRAAKELWKFCNLGDIAMAAHDVRAGHSIDWWERAATKQR